MAAVWQCCKTPTFAPKTSFLEPLCKLARRPCHLAAWLTKLQCFCFQKYRNIEKISTLKLPKACHATKMQGRLASLYKGSQNDVLGAKVGVLQHCQTAAMAAFWQPSAMRPSIHVFWLFGKHMATLPGNLVAAYWQGCISLDFAPKTLLWQHLCELDMQPKYKIALQACIKVTKMTFWVQK